MQYNIKAIETKFRGYQFRSRLEARWAAFFELIGWKWDYEPVDFNGWIPDFAIYGHRLVYVEIKPVVEFPNDVEQKVIASGCKEEVLVLGQTCILPNGNDLKPDHQFGWLGEWCYESHLEEKRVICFDDALFGLWDDSKNQIGFTHGIMSYQDRITGCYDGGSWLEVDIDHIKELWATAHNLTRWMPSRSN